MILSWCYYKSSINSARCLHLQRSLIFSALKKPSLLKLMLLLNFLIRWYWNISNLFHISMKLNKILIWWFWVDVSTKAPSRYANIQVKLWETFSKDLNGSVYSHLFVGASASWKPLTLARFGSRSEFKHRPNRLFELRCLNSDVCMF